jgi:predicted metal-dependent enzyme (double-stranded beta helix superfamily)
VLNADGLITVSPNTLAAALNVAADTTATFRIYANNLAGTGVAFFIDRV